MILFYEALKISDAAVLFSEALKNPPKSSSAPTPMTRPLLR